MKTNFKKNLGQKKVVAAHDRQMIHSGLAVALGQALGLLRLYNTAAFCVAWTRKELVSGENRDYKADWESELTATCLSKPLNT